MQITVLKDGTRLLWQCEECPARGMGCEEMNLHMLRTGHEWFDNLGTRLGGVR